ncbi:hypothetical protein FB446DRAFT_708843 [Lentinula raphanica]|nr:hypothetical protein FB446DRAFT_708843 [Lentinula raphanica]
MRRIRAEKWRGEDELDKAEPGIIQKTGCRDAEDDEYEMKEVRAWKEGGGGDVDIAGPRVLVGFLRPGCAWKVSEIVDKIRIVSADTWCLKRLKDQASLKHEEVVQLRDVVARLRSQYTDTFRLRTELDGAMKLIQQLRIQVLVSLGCNLAEEQYVTAIFTNEATNFWSLVDEVKLRSKTSGDLWVLVVTNAFSANSAANWATWRAHTKLPSPPKSPVRDINDQTTEVQMKVPAKIVTSTAACAIPACFCYTVYVSGLKMWR